MGKASNSLKVLCKAMNYVACFALTMMMALIVIDVLLRAASYPFVGTFEIVSLLMGVVVGFGIPPGFIRQRTCLHGIPC
jgi:TRAP-type C4-dicarboxylate transport system permease small subunit